MLHCLSNLQGWALVTLIVVDSADSDLIPDLGMKLKDDSHQQIIPACKPEEWKKSS